MDTQNSKTRAKFGWARRALQAAAVAGALSLTTGALADPPYNMAPPVDPPAQTAGGDAALPDTVFKWTEIPQNQDVPIRRAVFDRGGYQLYDTAGETIVVPFANDNLYVMKFGESSNGKTYFRNESGVPVLYLPHDSYLENAAVPNARWYPFSHDFHPEHPVFVGLAPSWDAFVGMGWYPNMVCYGGYWGRTAFISGGLFLPTVGLFFEIGGHPYYGWDHYHDYYAHYPAPYRIGYWHRDYYRYAERPHFGDDHRFAGAGWNNHTSVRNDIHVNNVHNTYINNNTRVFRGAGQPYYAHRAAGGAATGSHTGAQGYAGGDHGYSGGSHTFRGADQAYAGGGHGYSGSHGYSGGHATGYSGGHSSDSHSGSSARYSSSDHHSSGDTGHRDSGGHGSFGGHDGGDHSFGGDHGGGDHGHGR